MDKAISAAPPGTFKTQPLDQLTLQYDDDVGSDKVRFSLCGVPTYDVTTRFPLSLPVFGFAEDAAPA
jgi:hypothetical protein